MSRRLEALLEFAAQLLREASHMLSVLPNSQSMPGKASFMAFPDGFCIYVGLDAACKAKIGPSDVAGRPADARMMP